MDKKRIRKELETIRSHMPDGTKCTAMMDDLLAKMSVQRGGGNGNGPPTGP